MSNDAPTPLVPPPRREPSNSRSTRSADPGRNRAPGERLSLDVLIFGGGGAGLWLLDELTRRGYAALAVETRALGSGQTIASQGIIHGGLKYSLSGRLTGSAASVRDMPPLWRDCLKGRRQPDLRPVRVLSEFCCLWRTEALKSKLGFLGARAALRSQVESLTDSEIPEALHDCPGEVYRVDEPVIDPRDLLQTLAQRNSASLLRIAPEEIRFTTSERGVEAVSLRHPHEIKTVRRLFVEPRWVILTAGAGNDELRSAAGLSGEAMQRRPLHMVLARGRLPMLWGHCVDGSRTRATITSHQDSEGRTIWQIGGNVAEQGVGMTERQVVQFARRELTAVLPGVDFAGVEWSSYRIDRAEARTLVGGRPENPMARVEGNVVAAWPTKLALIPALVDQVVRCLTDPGGVATAAPLDWPRPRVASPPWEEDATWRGIRS